MYILMRDFRRKLLMVLVTFVSIIPFNANHIARITSIKSIASFIIIFLLLLDVRSWFRKKYFFLNLLVSSFCISASISAIQFAGGKPNYFPLFLNNIFGIVLLFFSTESIVSANCTEKFISTQIKLIFFFCVLNDILMIQIKSQFGRANTYLLGNKFDVSYMHIFLFALILYAYKKNISDLLSKQFIVVVYIISVVISIYTECTTALVANVVFLILYFVVPNFIKFVLNNPLIDIGFIAICDVTLILFDGIYQTRLFSIIVEDLLHESADLTGRTSIYLNVFNALSINPIFGVGKENNYEISSLYAHGVNLQNGVMDLLLSYGIVGLSIWCCIVMLCCTMAKRNKNDVLWMFIIIMIVASSLEVTFRQYFWMYLVYSSILSIDKVKEND